MSGRMRPLARLLAGLHPRWHSFSRQSYLARVSKRPCVIRTYSSSTRIAGAQGEPLKSTFTGPETSGESNLSEPRMAIAFTCTADGCNHRSAHTFTKRAYDRGIVLIQCPSCKNRHLIADNLGWFKDDTQNGQLKNVQDILRARGEHVQRGRLDADGVIEIPDN